MYACSDGLWTRERGRQEDGYAGQEGDGGGSTVCEEQGVDVGGASEPG